MEYIKFDNIKKSYGEQVIFENFSLAIPKGSFVTLLGPSGCGKSTLLRCLAGLEPIQEGSIFLDGEEITRKPAKDRNVGMIFQQYSLFPTMTVFNNIAFGLKTKKRPKEEIRKLVFHALEMVDLSGTEKKYPSQLSGGEQQRVALARCLVTKPKVLLLDEPFSAIDAKLRKALQIRIKEIHDEMGITSIFVTHDQDEAMNMSDSIHLMYQYRIEQSGSPLGLYTNPKTEFVASFMGNNNILKGDEFQTLTGKKSPAEAIVIRPELIKIGKTQNGARRPYQSESEYCISAAVKRLIPQGNIVRYKVISNEIPLVVDTLFNKPQLYREGQSVELSFSASDLYLLH